MRAGFLLVALVLAAGCGSAPTGTAPSDTTETGADPIELPAEPVSATDGPVVRYPERPTGETDAPMAEIRGELQLEGACMYIALDGNERYPIVWPAGTTWDSSSNSVIAPTGDVMAVGGYVEGGGGYFSESNVERLVGTEAADAVAACVDNDYREIAVVNNFDTAIGPSIASPATENLPDATAGIVEGEPARLAVGTHCGVEVLSRLVNGQVWRTSEASGLDWIPSEWSQNAPQPDGPIDLVVVLSAGGEMITASRNGRDVIYLPVGDTFAEQDQCA